MGELVIHTLFEALNVIGQFVVEMIFETVIEICQGALEGMQNRINGRYW